MSSFNESAALGYLKHQAVEHVKYPYYIRIKTVGIAGIQSGSCVVVCMSDYKCCVDTI